MSPELKRTLRSVVQIIVFAAGALPSVVEASGVPMYGGVVASLAVAAGLTRVMQVPAVQPFLALLGLDAPVALAAVVKTPSVVINTAPVTAAPDDKNTAV
jgi:hypothetical protein